jgi:hypothetical protein
MLQSVLNNLKNIKPLVRTYILSLILSNGRKNCKAMSEELGSSSKQLYSFLSDHKIHSEQIKKELIELAKKTKKKGVLRTLVVDPTSIIKPYSKKIEKVCYDRSGCTGRPERCLVPVYLTIVDENVTIPLNFDFWMQKKITGKKKYKSKVQIAQELIMYAIENKVEFDFVSVDGAFCGPDLFAFLKSNNLKFTMRIPRNRKIKIDGNLVQLQDCPELKLVRNERSKTIKAELYEDTYCFTSQKRKKCNGGWEVVFIVSNMNLEAKEQIAAYDLRWPMEKMIRTTKQKFGAMQCQAISAEKQRAHILAGFLTYAVTDLVKNDKKKQSVDEVVNIIRKSHFNDLINVDEKATENEYSKNVDPVKKHLQNAFKNLTKKSDSMGGYALMVKVLLKQHLTRW